MLCVKCASTCLTCSADGANSCLSCDTSGTYKYFKTSAGSTIGSCVSDCGSGYYGTNDYKCKECNQYCVCSISADHCDSCTGKQFLYGTSCVDKSTCENYGKIADETSYKCLGCDAKCAKCVTKTSSCTECAENYGLLIDKNDCVYPCPSGYYLSSN